jgi:hypothetical protein
MLRRLRGRRAPVTAELLVREGCHLCDDAERVVGAVFGHSNVRVRDIIGDRRLEDEFVFRIPVLRCGEQVLAEGVITRASARAAFAVAVAMARDEDARG